MRTRAFEKDESGFTMVEIIVVVIILAVLALIAIPSYLNQRKAAWQSSVQSDVSNAAIRIAQTKDFSGANPDTKLSDDTVLKVLPGPTLLVGKSLNNACVEAWHSKSPSDTIWSFNLQERELKRGGCELS